MQSSFLKNAGAEAPWLEVHPLSQEDSVAVAALRSVVAPMKGKVEGTAGRGLFDGVMERAGRVGASAGRPNRKSESSDPRELKY